MSILRRKFHNFFLNVATLEDIKNAYCSILRRNICEDEDVSFFIKERYSNLEVINYLLHSDEYRDISDPEISMEFVEQLSLKLLGASLSGEKKEQMLTRRLLTSRAFTALNAHIEYDACSVTPQIIEKGYLTLLGRKPTHEETGFYLEAGTSLGAFLQTLWNSQEFLDNPISRCAAQDELNLLAWCLMGRELTASELEALSIRGRTMEWFLSSLHETKEIAPITEDIVEKGFATILNRFPTREEISYHLHNNTALGMLIIRLWNSEEFDRQNAVRVDADMVFSVYQLLLNRVPNPEESLYFEQSKPELGGFFKHIYMSEECKKQLHIKPANNSTIQLAFQNLLGRIPQPEETEHYRKQCFTLRQLLTHIWNSEEFQANSQPVLPDPKIIAKAFTSILRRPPTTCELAAYKDHEFVLTRILQGLWMSEEFSDRPEPAGLTASQATCGYLLLLGRNPSREELDYHLEKHPLLGDFLEYLWQCEEFQEVRTAELLTDSLIKDIYIGILHRQPTQNEMACYLNERIDSRTFIERIWRSEEQKTLPMPVIIDTRVIVGAFHKMIGRGPRADELEYFQNAHMELGLFLQTLWQAEEAHSFELLNPEREDIEQAFSLLLNRYPNDYEIKDYLDTQVELGAFLKGLWRSEERENRTSHTTSYALSEYCYDGLTFGMIYDSSMRDNITMSLKSRSFIWEEELSILRLFKNPGCLVDIGANIGAVTILAGALGWHGVSIEASTQNVQCLQRGIRYNNIRFDIGEYAVSDQSGMIDFIENGPWGSISNEIISREENSSRAFQDGLKMRAVRALCLNDWENPLTGLHNLSVVDLIKMDIEGAEYSALCGMDRFLNHFQFPPIFSESNGFNLFTFHRSIHDLFEKYEELGYFPYLYEKAVLSPVDKRYFQLDFFKNYLFIHKDDSRFDVYISKIKISQNMDVLAQEIADGINNGWHQQQKHLIYSLKDHPALMQYSCISRALEEIRAASNDPDIKTAMAWYNPE